MHLPAPCRTVLYLTLAMLRVTMLPASVPAQSTSWFTSEPEHHAVTIARLGPERPGRRFHAQQSSRL
jgi:hypothetical protein